MTERADGLSHQLAQARRQRDELLGAIGRITASMYAPIRGLEGARLAAQRIGQEIEEEANDAEDEG